MEDYRLGVVETRFAELVWANEPISSGELVKLCAKELEWKKSTTYTVLKKMCDKGLFQNVNGTVTALVSQKAFLSGQSRQFVADTFSGSLPAFIAAFADSDDLSDKDIFDIQRMIEAYRRRHKE